METTAVLPEIKIDPDIEDILERISFKDSRAYQLGYVDGQKIVLGSDMANVKSLMVGPAEVFYSSLQKIIPKEDILQHRIGTDYTTGVPTTLTVIAQKYEDKILEIMYMASDLELYLFHEHDIDCQFWAKTDANLMQTLVEQDFPYYRRDI